jgi:hypothetical protein
MLAAGYCFPFFSVVLQQEQLFSHHIRNEDTPILAKMIFRSPQSLRQTKKKTVFRGCPPPDVGSKAEVVAKCDQLTTWSILNPELMLMQKLKNRLFIT